MFLFQIKAVFFFNYFKLFPFINKSWKKNNFPQNYSAAQLF